MIRSNAITLTDRVHSVLARDESLLDVFTAASPTFEKLRSPSLRKTMARLVTVEQAARIAGIDANGLVDRLNAALKDGLGDGVPTSAATIENDTTAALPIAPVTTESTSPIPEKVRAIAPDLLVDCDVREDLRAGIEPLKRILDAARQTPDGGVLRVRAIFEPVPLYAVLGRQGFTPHTESFARDDWQIWFHRDGGPAAANGAEGKGADVASPKFDGPDSTDSASDDAPFDESLIVLDVRDLEPPEPMARTLEALATMPKGHTLIQLNVRVPQFLIAELERRGFTWEVREQSKDLVRVFIRHSDA